MHSQLELLLNVVFFFFKSLLSCQVCGSGTKSNAACLKIFSSVVFESVKNKLRTHSSEEILQTVVAWVQLFQHHCCHLTVMKDSKHAGSKCDLAGKVRRGQHR